MTFGATLTFFGPTAPSRRQRSSILKNAWVPFASRPRQCPARNFAPYEQRALAVMLTPYLPLP
ncbi:hypothetical protein K503DRAFT_765292 [Rhizopogon vinicolor AM-OR11-026]|uniref:Cytochrome P450 n=1 Tax=Rhizopogon vinicolor AM-OR11-026 TaxID=1314800 RepID=A0A1B7NGX3_9AGAM|nr:hypothetical protein K503DRAFT_765292 [Rhizopogon vinicolor AM-OR11-026]